jgi:hypothetical protein
MVKLAVLRVYQPEAGGIIRLFPALQNEIEEKGDLIKDDYL